MTRSRLTQFQAYERLARAGVVDELIFATAARA